MSFERTTDAASEPLTTTEAKLHLKVDSSDDDTLIERLIKAARRFSENYTERSFITQTWKARFDKFPDVIELLYGPVLSITSIEYIDEDGDTQTLSSSNYTTDLKSKIARITPVDEWPDTDDVTNAVTVTYTAGFGASSANVPEDIRAAMLLIIGKLYESREDNVKKMPTAAECLLNTYKVYHAL